MATAVLRQKVRPEDRGQREPSSILRRTMCVPVPCGAKVPHESKESMAIAYAQYVGPSRSGYSEIAASGYCARQLAGG